MSARWMDGEIEGYVIRQVEPDIYCRILSFGDMGVHCPNSFNFSLYLKVLMIMLEK